MFDKRRGKCGAMGTVDLPGATEILEEGSVELFRASACNEVAEEGVGGSQSERS